MGLLDVFKRKTPIEKASKDLREPYAQPDVRRAAMATLLDIGTDEAYVELLRRFTFNSHGNIADESEKRDLVKECVAVGDPMVGPLKTFIENEKAITFPIRALTQIISKKDTVLFLIETLRSKDPLDHRTTDAKRALVTAVGDMAEPEQCDALFPYLEDHNDDVQMQVIDALERLAWEGSTEALAMVCSRDTHAGRVQHRAAQSLQKLGFSVKKFYDGFQPDVKNEFILGKKGVLARKGSK